MQPDAWEQSYVEFVTARQTHLRRIAYAICGDWQRADELLAAALVKLYVAWPRLQREGSEEVYVRRLLVRSHVATHARSSEPAATGVFAALQSLPPRQRKVAVLHHWLGLSVEETAQDLGSSPAAVRHQAARALAALSTDVSDAP